MCDIPTVIMRRTFVTRVEDKVGSFLKVAKIIGSCGGNIVRTSYNRSVDSNTMFLDVEADDESVFERISDRLGDIGFLKDDGGRVILINIRIPDVPNAVIPVLEILSEYNVNISYMNAQDNGTPIQHFRMPSISMTQPRRRGFWTVSRNCTSSTSWTTR